MVAVSRTRERPLPIRRGRSGSKTVRTQFVVNGVTYQDTTTSTTSGPFPDGHEICQDRVTLGGERRPNSFLLTKRTSEPGFLNGAYTRQANAYTTYTYSYSTFSSSRLGSCLNTGIKTYTPENPDYWLTQLLASLSRARAPINLPNMLWELRELPSLIKHLGDLLALTKNVPRTEWVVHSNGLEAYFPGVNRSISLSELWLAYSFGWKPLISDILKLIGVADAIQTRVDELKRQRVGKKFRRTLASYEDFSVVAPKYDFETVVVDILDHRKVKVWATGYYDVANVGELQYLIDKLSGLHGGLPQISSALGLSTSSITTDIWNSIPWSFLIDYLFNAGAFIAAHQNKFGVHERDVCVMIHDRAEETSRVVSNPNGLKYSPHKFVRETKLRSAYPEPNATVQFRPILTWRQLANLGALITAPRIARYYRTS